MARKATLIRKVYQLPEELSARVQAFCAANKSPSETAAALRLIAAGLDTFDTPQTVTDRLKAAALKRPSSTARELFVTHAADHRMLTRVAFGDGRVDFELGAGETGLFVWPARECEAQP